MVSVDIKVSYKFRENQFGGKNVILSYVPVDPVLAAISYFEQTGIIIDMENPEPSSGHYVSFEAAASDCWDFCANRIVDHLNYEVGPGSFSIGEMIMEGEQ